jgi:hypothetical protein
MPARLRAVGPGLEGWGASLPRPPLQPAKTPLFEHETGGLTGGGYGCTLWMSGERGADAPTDIGGKNGEDDKDST